MSLTVLEERRRNIFESYSQKSWYKNLSIHPSTINDEKGKKLLSLLAEYENAIEHLMSCNNSQSDFESNMFWENRAKELLDEIEIIAATIDQNP